MKALVYRVGTPQTTVGELNKAYVFANEEQVKNARAKIRREFSDEFVGITYRPFGQGLENYRVHGGIVLIPQNRFTVHEPMFGSIVKGINFSPFSYVFPLISKAQMGKYQRPLI